MRHDRSVMTRHGPNQLNALLDFCFPRVGRRKEGVDQVTTREKSRDVGVLLGACRPRSKSTLPELDWEFYPNDIGDPGQFTQKYHE